MGVEEVGMLYYYFRIPIKKQKTAAVASIEAKNLINTRSAELNRKGPDNVWFYVVRVAESYVDLCANIGFRNKEKPATMAKEFVRALGFDPAMATSSEVSTEDFARFINTSKQNGYIDNISYVLLRSTVGDFRECTSGKYKEELIGNPLKKEEIYEMMEKNDLSDILKEEVDRIYSTEGLEFKGHPVHYVIYSDGYGRKNSIVEVLLTALYSAGRLRSKRYALMDGDASGTLVDILDSDMDERLFNLYRSSGGATIAVYPSDCMVGYDEPDIEEFHTKLAAFASDKRQDVLTVLGFSHCEMETARNILSKMDGMRFVEINDRINNGERLRTKLKERAEADGFMADEELLSRIEGETGDMTEEEIDKVYTAWVDVKLGDLYPQYGNFDRITAAIIDVIKADDAYSQLQSLIGLKSAKDVIDRIIGYHTTRKMFKEAGIPGMNPAYHMVFTGSPGTAKTTVARLFARIMKDTGILPKGDLVEVGRQDLVGQYVGWTAKAVENAFDKARGSVLFIDEAYSLCDGREGSFGDEAINTIVQLMENRREDTVVIFAGYPDRMNAFLDRNPGLRSRITYHVAFDDYSEEELLSILKSMSDEAHLHLAEASVTKVTGIFAKAKGHRDFGNGRFVRNLFEQARMNLAYRVSKLESDSVSMKDLTTLVPEDFELPSCFKPEPKRRMGFCS